MEGIQQETTEVVMGASIDKTLRDRRYWTRKGREVTATGKTNRTAEARYIECIDEKTRQKTMYLESELRPLPRKQKENAFSCLRNN